jgi:hypothetical protein
MGFQWYISFYASWYAAQKLSLVEPLWVTYEDMITYPERSFKEMTSFLGVPKGSSEINSAIEVAMKGSIKYNKGVIGRGKANMTVEQMDRIRHYASFYPNVDFSLIGI